MPHLNILMAGKKRSTFIIVQRELLDPLDDCCGVVARNQLSCQMDPRGLEAVHPLHLRDTAGWWEMVLVTPPPKINDHPLALNGVESEVGCYRAACQLLRLLR